MPLINGFALQVDNYTRDATAPELENYDVSLDEGSLTLFFTETVDAATLDVSQITLLDGPSEEESTQVYRLTTTSVYRAELLSVDSPGIDVLEASGMAELSGSGSGSSFSGAAGNETEVGGALNDNAVDSSIEMAFGSGSGSGSGSGMVDMTRFRSLSSFNSHVVTLYFSHFDLNTIKALTRLTSSQATTFLSLTNSTVADMARMRNYITEVNISQPLPVRNYTRDATSPVLRGFSFDLNVGNLTLTFTETVNISSLDVTQIMLTGAVCTGTNHTLRAMPLYPNTSAAFGEDWPEIVIRVGHEDLDAIKNLRDLFSGRRNSLLYLTMDAVRDNANNRVSPIGVCDAPRARDFVHDTTRPELVSFDMDMDNGRLVLTFSETVRIVDSLDVTQITLQATLGRPNDPLLSYTLTHSGPFPSSSMDADSRVVPIMLGFTDLNAIKYRSELATSRNDTYVSITDLTVLDLPGNPVESGTIRTRIFTPDTSSPVLVNFTLNMNTTTLILTFNETVNASSFQVDQISIQHGVRSSSDYNSSSRFLTPGEGETFTASDNDHTIVVNLGPLDRNEIKKRRGLAISAATSYLTATMSSIVDMNGNPLRGIADGRAQQVASFVNDTTPPTIANFTMDMNEGRFILTFDETVMATSLMRMSISFQDEAENSTIWLELNGRGSHTLEDSTIITVSINIYDLNEMKRLTICRQQERCFLVHEESTILDMVDNPIASRGEGSALQPSTYLPDVTSPTLLRFETNLTSEVIRLTFECQQHQLHCFHSARLLPGNFELHPHKWHAAECQHRSDVQIELG